MTGGLRRAVSGDGDRAATGDGGGSTARGLSTSASFLIVFIGLFVALGSLYTATGNTAERLADAGDDQRERHAAVQETAVTVTAATWDSDAETLTVRANNTGDTTLTVSDADTVVDGTYVPIAAYERVEVDGQATDVWRPGEQLVLEDTDALTILESAPDRVRLVTETGVAATREVSDV